MVTNARATLGAMLGARVLQLAALPALGLAERSPGGVAGDEPSSEAGFDARVTGTEWTGEEVLAAGDEDGPGVDETLGVR